MAYLGKAPVNGFHAKQSLTGDGSTVTFTLDQTVATETALIVSVGGVLQEPAVAYNLAIGGTKITFTEAPSSTDTVYIHFLGTAIVQNLLDVNGAEFVLDLNGNTSFTADTDDEIDIKVGGTDINTIKATGFHNIDSIKYVAGAGDDLEIYHDGTNSLIANKTGTLKIATETSGVPITIGHTTSEVTIADNATVAGNLTVTGTLTQTGTQTFDGGIDVDNFNINGTTIALSSGDMTLDSAGDIILDADGGDVFFKDAGTTFGSATNTSGNLIIKSGTTTALTFSGANVTAAGTITGNLTGNVTGNASGTALTVTQAAQSAITSLGTLTALTVDDVAIDGKVMTMTGSSGDTFVTTVGTNGATSLVTVDTAAAAAHLTITADGTVDINSAGVLTLDSGAAINIEPASGSAILLDGTISIDAGVVTGATSITSTAFVGDITGDVTGNADTATALATARTIGGTSFDGSANIAVGLATLATTVTITDNESTDENNAIVFTAGGDVDGGNLGLESDGDLTYNPSSGTLNVPNISVTGTQTIVNSVTMNASNAVIFEGATADAHETTLSTVDATADRTINLPNQSGTLPVLAAASATAITSTPEELNLIDGGTARGTDAVASGDGILINDGGTMKMTNVDTVSTYFASHTVGGGNIVTTGALGAGSIAAGFGAIDNGTSTIRSNIITAETGFRPAAQDGAALGTTSLQFSDLFLADAAVVGFGDDNEVTLTHIHDTGIRLNSTMKLQFNDASQFIHAPSATVLDIAATDEIELTATLIDVVGNLAVSGTLAQADAITMATNKKIIFRDAAINISSTADGDLSIAADDEVDITSTLIDINGNVEISGTATTTGVHTFTAVPVFPNNTIETADIQADAITGAKIADDAINSEHYTDGSIDTAHIDDLQVTGAKLALDHRSANATDDVKTGNQHDYIFFDADVGISFFSANAEDMRLTDAGALHVDNDVIAFSTTISDERLKDNIQPIEDALSKVNQLRGVTFTYISDGRDSAGLIAQDVEKVLPSAVRESELPLQMDGDKEYKILQYDQTIGLLVEAIKELTAKVEKLEKK